MNAAQKYELSISKEHKRNPTPFNPAYDPDWEKVSNLASVLMEADQVFSKYTLKERQALNLRSIYVEKAKQQIKGK